MEAFRYSGDVATQYASDQVLSHPTQAIIYNTWLREHGEVRGMRILDLACGSGRSSRLLAERDAIVTGVDREADMIELATRTESESPLGIEYVCADAAELDLGRRFERGSASFLYHYAQTRVQMERMVRATSRHLVSDARLVGLSSWSPIVPRSLGHGHWTEWADQADTHREGAEIRLHILDADGLEACPPIVYHFWQPHTIQTVLEAAGFGEARWIPHRLPDEVRAQYRNWRELEETNASCTFTAVKLHEVT